MKITEVIYFGFELNLLEAHLEQHKNIMDHIIVVECGRTTTGVPKPLLFEENKERFNKYNVEHIILPDSTYPIETKTFLEFKHQDPNGKNIIHPYASFNADWVFHNDTDEILEPVCWTLGAAKLRVLTDEVKCVHHHLDQRSPFVNLTFGKFHVHRIYRSGDKISAPKQVKRSPLVDRDYAGWHFTNCFSTPEEIYWKIKCRNWLITEQNMEFCKEIYKEVYVAKNILDSKEFDDVRFMFPTDTGSPKYTDLPKFMEANREMFPFV